MANYVPIPYFKVLIFNVSEHGIVNFKSTRVTNVTDLLITNYNIFAKLGFELEDVLRN
ncbi:MAG: hypothetical protein WAN47_04250 [Nitrosotalea sp.]